MRLPIWRLTLPALLVAGAACGGATAPRTTATLALSTAPDFSGTVAQVRAENAVGPEGAYSQYDVWVTVPPATAASAGVVVPLTAPVFVRSGGGAVTVAGPSDIRVGDVVDVWHDRTAAYGAVQGPPGAPTYIGTQIVVAR